MARPRDGLDVDLPPDVSADATGRIRTRQPTHWDLEVDGLDVHTLRVHFTGEAEFRFKTPNFTCVSLSDDHPLLADFVEPSTRLFIARSPKNPARVIHELMKLVLDWSGGWRAFLEYAETSDPLGILTGGQGLLLTAPHSLAHAAHDVLLHHDAEPTIVAGDSANLVLRALCLGPNFILAQGFEFEGLGPDGA